MAFLAACLVSAPLLPGALAQGYAPTGTNETGPLSQYKSRPDIYAPAFNITIYNEAALTPGYIFIAPYQTFQGGPYIYDNHGNLVYSGFGETGSGTFHLFHVCNVKGTDKLCYISGAQNQGYSRGHGVIMDDTLTTWTSVKSGGGGVSNFDEHEFNIVDDSQNALMIAYVPEQFDLTEWGVSTGQGWIMNNYFQKIQLGTNKLLFEWSAMDHISIDETTVLPNSTEVSGTGFDPTAPWDWFHLNSVDQNADGDYLISARHVSTIYKISGQDGSVIWRLGGKRSDFTFADGQKFSFQHDARWREENATTTIISLFDNASNGYSQTRPYSSGQILKLDHTNNSVTILREYIGLNKMLSASQANLQLLGPNSAWDQANTFVGWGNNAYISEHLNDGTMVQSGFFATTGTMNYRAFKYNYTTNPTDSPALYTFARTNSSRTVYYMSWNGATRVASWRVYGAASRDGPWTAIDVVGKEGFETTFVAPQFHAWALVESLDADGKAIRNNSRPIKTFVPGAILASNCDDYECPAANKYVSAAATTSDSPATTASNDVSTATSSNAVARRSEQWKVGEMAMVGVGAWLMPS
ncbi:hypothetical protein DV735_g3074, partial [Chaetothyriales sp. CBS 134920]